MTKLGFKNNRVIINHNNALGIWLGIPSFVALCMFAIWAEYQRSEMRISIFELTLIIGALVFAVYMFSREFFVSEIVRGQIFGGTGLIELSRYGMIYKINEKRNISQIKLLLSEYSNSDDGDNYHTYLLFVDGEKIPILSEGRQENADQLDEELLAFFRSNGHNIVYERRKLTLFGKAKVD